MPKLPFPRKRRKPKPTPAEKRAACGRYVSRMMAWDTRVLGNGALWRERWVRMVDGLGAWEFHPPGWRAADYQIDQATCYAAMVERSFGLTIHGPIPEATWLDLDVDCHTVDPAWDDDPSIRLRVAQDRSLNAALAVDRIAAALELTGAPWLILATPRGYRLRLRFRKALSVARIQRIGAAIKRACGFGPDVEVFPKPHETGRFGYSKGITPVCADLVTRVSGSVSDWIAREEAWPRASVKRLERALGIRPDRAQNGPQTDPKNPGQNAKRRLVGKVPCVVRGDGFADQLHGESYALAVERLLADGFPGDACLWDGARKLAFAAMACGVSHVEALVLGDVVGDRLDTRHARRRWQAKYAAQLAYQERLVDAGHVVPGRARRRRLVDAVSGALGRPVMALRERAEKPAVTRESLGLVRRAAATARWQRAREIAVIRASVPRGAVLRAMTQPWRRNTNGRSSGSKNWGCRNQSRLSSPTTAGRSSPVASTRVCGSSRGPPSSSAS